MTKKHYIKIAAVFKRAKELENNDEDAVQVLHDLAYDLCTFFKEDNPNFDRERFMTACGF